METNKFLQALNQGREFIPIKVGSLRVDTLTHFDLYFQATPGEPEVLYADHALPFDEKSRKRLEDNQIEYLYIHQGQLPQYRRYIENNMPKILSDVSVPIEEKTQLLHLTAQGIVREVFEEAVTGDELERGRSMVNNTVELLFGQKTSLRQLIQTASVDYDLYTHSVNVCVIGLALAQRMGFAADKLMEFGCGALFRDIGMMNVDGAILAKGGSLSVAEFRKIQQHPIDSEQMLKDMNVDSPIALAVARHHHEKMDGSGYPDGLTGEDIPILVRVCTVVDIFDALTTNRKHKKALSSFEALNVMSTEMRHELDRDILRSLITLLGFS